MNAKISVMALYTKKKTFYHDATDMYTRKKERRTNQFQ